jgi:hypothetical protein
MSAFQDMPERNAALDEMLDDSILPVTIGTMKYYASDIFYSCDPIAYRIAVSEMEDAED